MEQGKHKSATMKDTRVKSAGMGGNTPVKGSVSMPTAADMKESRVSKKKEIGRKNDPPHKMGHMGMTIGTRVTRGQSGRSGKTGN